MSKVYSLKTVQTIPITLPEAWDFFSKCFPLTIPNSPGNLILYSYYIIKPNLAVLDQVTIDGD